MNMRYLRLLFGGSLICLMGMNESAAQDGNAPARLPWNTHVIPYTKFSIRYTVRDIGRAGPKSVEFYMTKDMGRSWERYAADPDARSPMNVQVPAEGTYGFMTVGTDQLGNRERAPVPGTRPETIVIVDRTKPTGKWLAPTSAKLPGADGITLAWESADKLPARTPVTIEYTTDGGKSWRPLKTRLPAKGRYIWKPSSRIGNSLAFRLIVRDRAGNRLTLNNKHVTLLDSAAPTVRLIGPALSRATTVDLTYEANDNPGGSGVAQVSLYTTLDDGRTWKPYGDDADLTSPFRFDSGISGRIGLALVATDKARNHSPLPRPGIEPLFYLNIDNEKPIVSDLDPTFRQPNQRAVAGDQEIDVNWRSSDANIKAKSATLFLSTDDGKNWTLIASGLPVNGPYAWKVPKGVQADTCMLKVTVTDVPGNVGTATTFAFAIDRAPPTTTITDVTPAEPPLPPIETENIAGATTRPQDYTPPSLFNTGGNSGIVENPQHQKSTDDLDPIIPVPDTTGPPEVPPVPVRGATDTKPTPPWPPIAVDNPTETGKPVVKKTPGIVDNLAAKLPYSNDRVSDLLQRARAMLEVKKTNRAISLLNQAMAMNTLRSDTVGTLALAYIQKREYPKAIRYAKSAIKLENRPTYWQALGDAHFDQSKEIFASFRPDAAPDPERMQQMNQHLKDAGAAFSQVTRMRPKYKGGFDRLGNVIHFQARQYNPDREDQKESAAKYYRGAIRAYEKAYQIGPVTYDECFQIGQSYLRLYQANGKTNDLSKAGDYLERAVEKASADRIPQEAYWYLGVVHELKKSWSSAAGYWLQAAKAYEKNPETAGYAKAAMRKYEAAKRLAGE